MRFQSNSVASLQDINTLLGIPPPTLNTNPQTYVDPTGELWIADANAYNGHWKRARDAVRSQVYRSGAYTSVANAETVYPFNAQSYSAYGEWNLATGVWTAPIDGIYRATCDLHWSIPAATTVRVYARFANSGPYGDHLFSDGNYVGAMSMSISGSASIVINAGGTISVNYYTNPAINSFTPSVNDIWCEIHFEQIYHL